MTQKFKVLVTRKWPKKVEEKLKENFDVTLNENDIPLSEKELLRCYGNFDAVLPTVTDSVFQIKSFLLKIKKLKSLETLVLVLII